MKILIGTNTFGSYDRQDIAVDSYKALKSQYPDVVDVIDVQFQDEKETFKNIYGLDVKFDLKRSSLDAVKNAEKKLPFVNDIFNVIYDHSSDYCIFTNSDVILNKSLVEYIIKNKPDCFACSRLDIQPITSFSELREKATPVRWEIAGFDTFVFKRDWFFKYRYLFHDYLLGRPQFDHVYAGIMKCFGDNTPLGNQNPAFCFHIHHKVKWLDGSGETDFNNNSLKEHALDHIMANLMFFNLKHNLCRRKPWGAFLQPEANEQQQEKMFFDTFNVHTENYLLS
jgi:hypothetical protein